MTAPHHAPPSVGVLSHDFGGDHALWTYAPEAAGMRQGDRIHRQLYGVATSSPLTPYICVWRNPAGPFGPEPPAEVFLAAVFGTEAWRPPDDLVHEATARQTRDEALFRAAWRRGEGGFHLTRLELEVNPLGHGRNFRSVNFGDELAELDLTMGELRFPAERSDSFAFRLSGQIRQRRNRGEPMRQPAVRFMVAATAVPSPPWLMY